MTTMSVADPVASQQASLRSMTTEQLLAEFHEGLRVSVKQLNRLALVFVELESRGEKVSGVNEGLLVLLGRIGNGKLLAEVVVRFATTPQTMRRVGRLPLNEQRAIIADPEECARLTRPKPKVKQQARAERKTTPYDEDYDTETRRHVRAARLSTPKDLAALIVEMIAANTDPARVWAEVCRLQAG